MTSRHNWDSLDEKLVGLIRRGEVDSIMGAAQKLGIMRGTLQSHLRDSYNGMKAADLPRFPEIYEKAQLGELERWGGEEIFEEKQTNSWQLAAKDRRIKTLADLLRVCEVDLDVWEVERHVVNKWEYGNAEGDIFPLFQVKAWLVRKEPIAVFPTIHPVQISLKLPKPPKPKKKGLKRMLAFADLQVGFRRDLPAHPERLIPFHDRRALDMVLQIMQYEHGKGTPFDGAALVGDGLDMSEWSTRWVAEPEFFQTTQPALIELHWWLAQMRPLVGEFDYIEGNHNRFKQAILSNLQAAYELRSVDELERPASLSLARMLALDSLDITYIGGYADRTAEKWLNPMARLVHADVSRSNPGASAAAMLKNTTFLTVSFHTHRKESASQQIALPGGQLVTAESRNPGCMCHTDGRVPGSKKDSNWQQGFEVTSYDDEMVESQSVRISEGQAIWDGKVFTARDVNVDGAITEGLEKIEGD